MGTAGTIKFCIRPLPPTYWNVPQCWRGSPSTATAAKRPRPHRDCYAGMSTRADREVLAERNSHRQGETVEERCDRVGNPPQNIRDAIQHTFDDPEPGALDPSSKMASVEAAVGSTVITDTAAAATATGSGAGAGADSEKNTKQQLFSLRNESCGTIISILITNYFTP